MKDFLLDLVRHTQSLGIIDAVKITGTDTVTSFSAVAEDRSVVVQGKFHQPMADFIGTFGIPNLNKLNVLLNIQEYKEDANISVTRQKRNDVDVPVGIHFENKAGDFKNDYRFMSTEIINEKVKDVKFLGANWHVEFKPTVNSIQRFKFQSQANNEETTFIAKVDGDNLVFYFGDHSTHAGNFVFESGVTGKLSKGWSWPVTQVLSILGLSGDISMKFSDDGAAQIVIDSGIAEYTYILPAHRK
jgi:hypothetical protein